MFAYQGLAVLALTLIYAFFLSFFLRRFKKDLQLLIVLLTPIVVFSLGYVLRISGIKPVIDVGYFFTDSSYIFIYSLFTTALVVGQIKFWKKN